MITTGCKQILVDKYNHKDQNAIQQLWDLIQPWNTSKLQKKKMTKLTLICPLKLGKLK